MVFFISFSFKSFTHETHHSEEEIETALRIFKKAILLSSDFSDRVQNHSVVPFYKINGYKVYLDKGFWDLTRAWIRVLYRRN